MKTWVWIGMVVGSTIGAYIPTLWGADFISISSIFFSGVGALAGIWVGFRCSQY